MIVAFNPKLNDYKLEIGKIIVVPELYDNYGKIHRNIPVFVLGEASEEDFQKSSLEMCGMKSTVISGDKFYRISID